MIPPQFRLGALGVMLTEGKVLLVRASYGAMRWQLPGGFVEPNECVAAALDREIREELGVTASIQNVIGFYQRTFDATLNILFRIVVPYASIRPDPLEILDFGLFALTSLPAPISPRTARMITDTTEGQISRLVVFSHDKDPGRLVGAEG